MVAGFKPLSGQDFDPEGARQKAISNYLQRNAMATSGDYSPDRLQQYDWAQKAAETSQQAQSLNMQSLMNQQQNFYNQLRPTPVAGSPVAGTGGNEFQRLFRAMAGQESGGNYGARNADSGAMGKYQIMPANLGGSGSGWDYEALGKDVSPQQFMSSKQIQDAIARYKFQQYFNKYGAAGALSAWYSGDPNKWNSKTPQGNYPSIYNYVQSILRAAGLA